MTRAEFAAAIKEKYLENGTGTVGERMEVYDALFHTGSKLIEHFGSHEKILISVSGGSDSDCIVHLVCTYFPEYLDKCHFVFVNTGLEYAATKRHLTDLEQRYSIQIQSIRGESVVSVIRKYGVPILNKLKSHVLNQYMRDVPSAKKYIFMDGYKVKRLQFTKNQRILADYLKDNKIWVSEKCCDLSKKKPLYKYININGIDLNCTGERDAEGGQRAMSHKSCFEEGNHGIDKYMPLWWWSDDVKATFKQTEGIRFSDCYEVYGMKRTGCCGCPFNLNIADDLQAMFEYEPQLFKACMKVFGQSYELMDRFKCRRKKCLPDSFQLSFGFKEGGD